MAKYLVRWISLAGMGLILWLWAMRPAAEAPPLPPLPQPSPMSAPARPQLAAEELPLSERPQRLVTQRPPPAPRPARQILHVAPPPTPTIAVTPRLPEAAYPQAGGAALAYSEAPAAPATPLNPGDYVQRAESASAQLDRLLRQGSLRAQFVGTGQAGLMVEMALENTSGRPITVRLVPGMILRPPDGQAVQPLMLDEEVTMTLAPGASAYRQLPSYCMDSRVPAPFSYQPIDYRFSPRTKEGGAETVRVFQAAQQLEIHSPLPEAEYRRAVAQIAIWKSLHQPVDEMRQRSAMGPAFFDPALRKAIMRDVDRVLQQAR